MKHAWLTAAGSIIVPSFGSGMTTQGEADGEGSTFGNDKGRSVVLSRLPPRRHSLPAHGWLRYYDRGAVRFSLGLSGQDGALKVSCRLSQGTGASM